MLDDYSTVWPAGMPEMLNAYCMLENARNGMPGMPGMPEMPGMPNALGWYSMGCYPAMHAWHAKKKNE